MTERQRQEIRGAGLLIMYITFPLTNDGHRSHVHPLLHHYTHVRATWGEMPWQRIAPTHTPPSHKKRKKQDAERLLSCLATCMSVGSFPTKPFSEAVGCNYGENCADGSSTRGPGCSGWRSEQTYTLPAIVRISTNTWHRHEQHAPRTSRTLTAGAYYGYVVLVPVLAPRV